MAACLVFLRSYHQQLLKIFRIDVDSEGNVTDGSDDDKDSAFCGTGSQNTPSDDFVRVSSRTAQVLSRNSNLENNSDLAKWADQTQQILDSTQQHIMSVMTALCRILAYRVRSGGFLELFCMFIIL